MSDLSADLVFGLDTFGDLPEDDSGAPVSYPAAIRQVVEEAVLADETGVDVVALGVGRFDLIYTAGAQPISARIRAVELYGTKVIPLVRDILAG